MKNKYNANNLFVGRMMYTSSDLSSPIGFQSDVRHIFEAKSIKDKAFKEIFTGEIAESEYRAYSNGTFYKKFDKLYIINIEYYTDYFPRDYGDTLSLEELKQRFNEINGIEEQEKLGR
jgi:hypothetical protein